MLDRPSTHRAAAAAVENCFSLPQQCPGDPYKLVSQRAYRGVRMRARSETPHPLVLRIVPFVHPGKSTIDAGPEAMLRRVGAKWRFA